MAYSMENWPKAADLNSAVQRLWHEFHDAYVEAQHASVYECDKFNEEFCKELERKYSDGMRDSEDFLSKKIDLNAFCASLSQHGLGAFLGDLKPYLPAELAEKYKVEWEESEETEELEDSEDSD